MSEYRFACTNCGQHLTALPGHAGMLIKCPTCQTELRIPPPPTSAPGVPLGAPPPMAPGGPVPPLPTSAGAPRSSNRGLIIGLVIAACVVVFLGLLAVGGVFFFRAVKRDMERQHQVNRMPMPPKVRGPQPNTRSLPPPMTGQEEQVATDPATVKIPDEPASGTIQGTDFRITKATLDSNAKVLKLSEGGGFLADREFIIFMFTAGTPPVDGKTILVPDPDANQARFQTRPHIHVRWKEGDSTRSTVLMQSYTLRIEFGKRSGNKLPGKIYLEAPERFQTKIAGAFEAAVER